MVGNSEVERAVQAFYMVLFNTLRSESPKDTGNMLANITYVMNSPNSVTITIAAPKAQTMNKKGKLSEVTDYAWFVNYSNVMAWGRKANRNKFWVEKCIMHAKRIIAQNIKNGAYSSSPMGGTE